MKVELKIQKDIIEPYAVICTDSITSEITEAVLYLENSSRIITAADNGRIEVLRPEEIYMVRIESEQTVIYCKNKQYVSRNRLYQVEEKLGKDFMKISRSTLINLKQLKCVEPSFKGMMSIVLKNGCRDYISRKYLPDFKKYLGI